MGTGFSLAAHDAIRNALNQQGSNIADIARQSGMSADYLYKRLRNELPFTVTDIERICDTLGIDPYTLLRKPDADGDTAVLEQLKQLTGIVADLKTAINDPTALTAEQREQIARQRIQHGVTLAANRDPHMQDEIDYAEERL